jgi:glycosyltransferase involved in cell wall biosynthesis
VHDLFYKNFANRKKTLLSKLYALYVDIKHKAMLKKAKKVVAISEFVKSDILKHFPAISKNKIVVIPNAVVMSEETSVPAGMKKPFLLYVSEHGIHKNHLTLMKAYNIIKNKTPHRLVLLGKEREETSNIKKYIHEKKLSEKIDLMSNVSDTERNWLYKNADLFISPSLHEGFGRTPVEAAMAGCMVLTSRETSLPEVTREVLNYYEPATDENALAAKILECLQNPIPEQKRGEIATMFREIYDPVKIAGMYYDLFQDVILHKNNDGMI